MINVPVYDYPNHVKAFVEGGLWNGRHEFDEDCTCIGFANERDGLVAGFVFNGLNVAANTIEVSAYIAPATTATRWHWQQAFAYPFDQLRVRAVVMRTSEHNARARAIMRKLGMIETRIPEMRGPEEAEIVGLLTRAAWQKFNRKDRKYGQFAEAA